MRRAFRVGLAAAGAVACGVLSGGVFARSYQAFEAQLCRMSGAEDGITDALFRFSQPLNTAYFWCPPLGWTV